MGSQMRKAGVEYTGVKAVPDYGGVKAVPKEMRSG